MMPRPKATKAPYSFAEPKEVLSESEQRFERIRHTIGLFLGPLAGLMVYLLPMTSLTADAHRLAAILVWVIIWWITEPIPIPMTALLGAVLSTVLGIAPVREVFAPFADPTIYLFLGSFILAEAMAVHNLHKRFAFSIMTLRWVGDSPGRILFAYGAVAAFLSMWISNTATAAMMLPIGIGIVHALHELQSQGGKSTTSSFATSIMLMAAYAASTGGIGTPVGTPPNLIGIAMIEKFVHVRIPFFQWMLLAVPLLILMYLLLFALLHRLHRPGTLSLQGSRNYIRNEQKAMGPWSRGQINTLAAFLITVLLWILPGLLAILYGTNHPIYLGYNARFAEAVVALLGALLLFILPINWREREFTLTWREASRIDWGTLILFGGGISLGQMMFQTKLAENLGQVLLSLSGAESVWGITLAAIYISIFVSEATSNTAAANMVIPVMISLALAAGLNPLPPAIGATIGCSWGFMLPVSTPPNAIVYGSGMVSIRAMIRAGFLFDILGGVLIWMTLRLLLPLMGMA